MPRKRSTDRTVPEGRDIVRRHAIKLSNQIIPDSARCMMPDFEPPDAMYDLSWDKKRLNRDWTVDTLRECYWSPKIRREVCLHAIDRSLCIGVYERTSGEQVAFARVVTDEATFAWICDVIVSGAHRGKGLSKWMMKSILEHPDLQTLRRIMLGTRDAHGLYAQFGFEPGNSSVLMTHRPPEDRWQDAIPTAVPH